MSLVNSAVGLYFKARYHRIERFLKNPIGVQNEVFKTLIESAKNTEWGQQWEYRSIRSEETFRNRVPVGDYESHKPYIDRMMRGTPNVLWPDKIKWFSKSSGTTNDKSKFLPVSELGVRDNHIRGTRDTLSMYFVNYPDASLFEGTSLVLSGTLDKFEPFPETIYGDVSAIMVANIPSFFRRFYNPSYDIALLAEWEKKLELTARQVTDKNITRTDLESSFIS
jgi:hypothetical protein